MTEDEALTKWCPFARTAAVRVKPNGDMQYGVTPPVFNRLIAADPSSVAVTPAATACLGSACMAWRKTTDVPGAALERRDMGAAPLPEGWLRSNPEHPDTLNKTFDDWIRPGPRLPTGFCGLSGAPQ